MGFFGAIKRIGEKVAGGVSRVGSVVSGVANEVAKVGAKVAPVLEAGLTAVGAPELAAGVAGGLKAVQEVGKVAGEVSKVAGGVNKQLQAGNIVGAVKSGLAGARSIRGGIGSGTTAGAGGLTTNRGMGVGAGGKGGLGVSPSALGTNALPSTQTATTQLGRMASGTRSTNAKAIETDVMNYVHRLLK
tara:strand:+ start:19538 stop:20101 length:564 start_codon:yes stop_codon:yes gene_type:complete